MNFSIPTLSSDSPLKLTQQSKKEVMWPTDFTEKFKSRNRIFLEIRRSCGLHFWIPGSFLISNLMFLELVGIKFRCNHYYWSFENFTDADHQTLDVYSDFLVWVLWQFRQCLQLLTSLIVNLLVIITRFCIILRFI